MSCSRSMRALIAKEARILWPGLAVGLPICALQAMTFRLGSLGLYIAYMAAATLVTALAGAFLDSHFRVDPLFAALPVSRKLLVGARYLWCAVVVLAMAGLTVAEEWAIGAFTGRNAGSVLQEAFGAGHGTLFLFLTAVPLAFYLPFLHRWGPGPGSARFFMALGAFAAMAGGAGFAVRTSRPGFAAAAAAALSRTVGAIAPVPGLLAATLALSLLWSGSFLLSARFYAARDL